MKKRAHISATADGVHIADTNGHFRVSGCDFSYMGDDSLNVHDNRLYIKQRVSDNALTVYASQYLLTIGDTMKFKLGTYADIDFEAKITDISADGVISFDRTLPEEIAADTVMYIAFSQRKLCHFKQLFPWSTAHADCCSRCSWK